MKNKILILFALALFISLTFASADIQLWRENIINTNTSIVRTHGYFQFQDDSTNLIGKSQSVPLAVQYFYQSLPYNISQTYPQYPNALVDWCNVTLTKNSFTYDSLGNTATENQTVYNTILENVVTNSNITYFEFHHQDSLIVDIDCHYTNPDTLFIDNVLFTDFDNWFPAYRCTECGDSKLQVLADEIKYNQAQSEKEISIYQKIQTLIGYNFKLWYYANYLIRILLVISVIALIFAMAYFIYLLIESLGRGR